MNQRWWLLLERAQATLPLLAAAGLAAFTWWLVESSPKDSAPARSAQAASTPDFELMKARVARFDAQGRLEAVVDGEAMRHYPSTDLLQIDKLVLSARDDKGQGLHAEAERGEADQRAEIVSLRGSARVTAYPSLAADANGAARGGPIRFTSEGLKVDTRARLVSTDQPLLLTQDHSQIHGSSLRYDDRTGIAELGGRVQGSYAHAPLPRTDSHVPPTRQDGAAP
jgi:lipopolysaccharide export system protein LptC